MSNSNRKKEQQIVVAEWLCDSYGEDSECHIHFLKDATDFINYMKAKGWEFRPAVMIVKKGQHSDG